VKEVGDSPDTDGVATVAGARVSWGMTGGFALGGGVDEVEGFAGEEAGPAMEKTRRLENGRSKKND